MEVGVVTEKFGGWKFTFGVSLTTETPLKEVSPIKFEEYGSELQFILSMLKSLWSGLHSDIFGVTIVTCWMLVFSFAQSSSADVFSSSDLSFADSAFFAPRWLFSFSPSCPSCFSRRHFARRFWNQVFTYSNKIINFIFICLIINYAGLYFIMQLFTTNFSGSSIFIKLLTIGRVATNSDNRTTVFSLSTNF